MRPEESFIAQPIRSLQTMLQVISEANSTIPTVIPDGIYGQTTLTAVSVFQRINGLPVTGIVDQITWEAIVAEYEDALIEVEKAEKVEIILEPGQVLRKGDRNPNLYVMQAMLLFLSKIHDNITEPAISGYLDSQTANSILSFQVLTGLPETGELDRKTWKYLANQFSLNANHESRFFSSGQK